MKKKKIRLILITLRIVLILMVSYRLYLEYQTDIQLFLNFRANKEELSAHIRPHGFSAPLLLIVLIAVICAVPGIPTSAIGVIAGLSFGSFVGAGINVLRNVLGSISAVFLVHRLKSLDKEAGKNHWVQPIRQMRHPRISVTSGYMIPMILPSMINFTADTIKLPLQQIVMLTMIGAVPSSVLYTCGGEALFHGYNKAVITLVASVTVLVGLAVLIYKDHKEKQGKQRQK